MATTNDKAVLWQACTDYMKSVMDDELNNLTRESTAFVRSKVVECVDVPKAIANQDWKDNLWDGVADGYYKRASDIDGGGDASTDFSSFGAPPHGYQEVKNEFIGAVAKKDFCNSKLFRMKADMPDSELVISLEEHLERDIPVDGFIGGVEVPIADTTKMYNEDKTYAEFFNTVESIDGTKAIIRCATPITPTAWTGASWDIVKKFNADFGVPLTQSTVNELIASSEYTNPTE